MFEEALVGRAKDTLAILGRSGILQDAYLAGGTAIALQLGHRISVDFDFFTPLEFVPKVVSRELSELGSFNEDLLERRRVIVLTKSDILDEEQKKKVKKLKFGKNSKVHLISAVSGDGISLLIEMMWKELQKLKEETE